MMSAFGEYSQYYDLLYRDKNYAGEVEFIEDIVRKLSPASKTILDLGCGTGRHARLLAQRGFIVHGIDNSREMLVIAHNAVQGENLSYSEGDIRQIRLNRSFKAVIALFHVMSYQISNDDLWSSLMTAHHHLSEGGLFIFDVWYGPMVLIQGPSVRIKHVEDETVEITRIAEPNLNCLNNTVTVNYHLFIKDKINQSTREITEQHVIRYLFKPELEFMLLRAGFVLERFRTDIPAKNTWSAWLVARKNS